MVYWLHFITIIILKICSLFGATNINVDITNCEVMIINMPSSHSIYLYEVLLENKKKISYYINDLRNSIINNGSFIQNLTVVMGQNQLNISPLNRLEKKNYNIFINVRTKDRRVYSLNWELTYNKVKECFTVADKLVTPKINFKIFPNILNCFILHIESQPQSNTIDAIYLYKILKIHKELIYHEQKGIVSKKNSVYIGEFSNISHIILVPVKEPFELEVMAISSGKSDTWKDDLIYERNINCFTTDQVKITGMTFDPCLPMINRLLCLTANIRLSKAYYASRLILQSRHKTSNVRQNICSFSKTNQNDSDILQCEKDTNWSSRVYVKQKFPFTVCFEKVNENDNSYIFHWYLIGSKINYKNGKRNSQYDFSLDSKAISHDFSSTVSILHCNILFIKHIQKIDQLYIFKSSNLSNTNLLYIWKNKSKYNTDLTMSSTDFIDSSKSNFTHIKLIKKSLNKIEIFAVSGKFMVETTVELSNSNNCFQIVEVKQAVIIYYFLFLIIPVIFVPVVVALIYSRWSKMKQQTIFHGIIDPEINK